MEEVQVRVVESGHDERVADVADGGRGAVAVLLQREGAHVLARADGRDAVAGDGDGRRSGRAVGSREHLPAFDDQVDVHAGSFRFS